MNAESYLQLLTERNYRREKFNQLTEAVLNPPVSNGVLIESFDVVFDLDNAVGNQLDMIGELVGASRLLNYKPTTGTRIMDDDEYRLVLRLQIAKNSWNGTIGSLTKVYSDALGTSFSITYVDSQDVNMFVHIEVYGDASTRMLEILRNSGVLLLPAGVNKDVGVIGGNVDVSVSIGTCASSIRYEDFVSITEE